MNEYLIRTDHLTRSFKKVTAVNNVSFEVPAGIVFGFLGPNGSGKTTTIRLLLGVLEPTSGRAEVLGFDTRTHSDSIRPLCGALLEHTGLYERLSAEDNLEFYGRVWQLPAAERQARIKELLNGLGLYDRRKETVGNWSRGMKQKLAVARAMLHRPRLLFLDEPTAGLDPVSAAALREDLAALSRQQGTTVFLTTHNLAEAEKLCSQVAVIDQGKLVTIGSPDELRMRQGGGVLEVVGGGFTAEIIAHLRGLPEVEKVEQLDHHVTLHFKGQPDTAPIVRWMIENGIQIDEVRKGQDSLEDVFLSLVEKDNELR